MDDDLVLPGLPASLIRATYLRAPGNEIASGKFASPESSAALVANSFGYFLERVSDLPPLPNCDAVDWEVRSIALEGVARFPWSGGRHPCLDVLITTGSALIGVESKRYEPYRPKSVGQLSDAYWRPVWGQRMASFERVRDLIRDKTLEFEHLDAVQLIKHAFGLRTAVQASAKRAVLLYLYAEPKQWPTGRPIPADAKALHRGEIETFVDAVRGDEVEFRATSYQDLLALWLASSDVNVRSHARAVLDRFDV